MRNGETGRYYRRLVNGVNTLGGIAIEVGKIPTPSIPQTLGGPPPARLLGVRAGARVRAGFPGPGRARELANEAAMKWRRGKRAREEERSTIFWSQR